MLCLWQRVKLVDPEIANDVGDVIPYALRERRVGTVEICQDRVQRPVGGGKHLTGHVNAVEPDTIGWRACRIESPEPVEKIEVLLKLSKAIAERRPQGGVGLVSLQEHVVV